MCEVTNHEVTLTRHMVRPDALRVLTESFAGRFKSFVIPLRFKVSNRQIDPHSLRVGRVQSSSFKRSYGFSVLLLRCVYFSEVIVSFGENGDIFCLGSGEITGAPLR